MHLLHLISLTVIAAAWIWAWFIGRRWCRVSGVDERVSLWALACVFPTAGLVFSVHLIALVSLLSGRGLITPAPVAVVFAILTWLVHRVSARAPAKRACCAPGSGSDAAPMAPKSGFGLGSIPIVIVAGVYLVFLVDALTRYPTGYDALYYHLPVAVRWMQERAFNLVIGFSYLSHPENGMMVPFLLAFGRLEWLFPLVHFPKALLTGAAIYGLTRALNVSPNGSKFAACIALSVPIVVFQGFSNYIDLYASASWLSALLALTWAARAPDRSQRQRLLALAGLSAGIALGSKTTFLLIAALLGLVAVAVEWIRPRESNRDRRRPMRNLALFGSAALVCSGFWFVRGTIQAGNPVYPLGVKIGNTMVLPGIVADDIFPRRRLGGAIERWWRYPWQETKYSGTGYPYSVNNGLGAAYAAFVPLGMLAAVLSLWNRPPFGGRSPPECWRIIFVVLSLTGLVLLLTVFREMLRFVLPQLLLAVAVAGLLIDRLVSRFPRTILATLTMALVITGAVASIKPARSIALRVKNGILDRAEYYGIPPLIDGLPPGTRIVNVGDPPGHYALLGRRLTNVVIDAGVWNKKLCPEGMSARALRDNAVDYVYVDHPFPADWPNDLPLELVYDGSERDPSERALASRIYRVSPTLPGSHVVLRGGGG